MSTAIAITVWRSPKLYDQLDQLLRRRPDGRCFYLLEGRQQVSPVTDFLISTSDAACMIDDIPHHLPYAAITLPFAETQDTFYLNYLLDEILYGFNYYDTLLQDGEERKIPLKRVHTMTLAQPDQLIVHAEEGNLIITDPQTIDQLIHCPVFIKGSDNIYFSHHYTYYPKEMRPTVYWPTCRDHQDAVQAYLKNNSHDHEEASVQEE